MRANKRFRVVAAVLRWGGCHRPTADEARRQAGRRRLPRPLNWERARAARPRPGKRRRRAEAPRTRAGIAANARNMAAVARRPSNAAPSLELQPQRAAARKGITGGRRRRAACARAAPAAGGPAAARSDQLRKVRSARRGELSRSAGPVAVSTSGRPPPPRRRRRRRRDVRGRDASRLRRYLADATKRVKEQGFYMKRAMDGSDLAETLKRASDMLRELRTPLPTPGREPGLRGAFETPFLGAPRGAVRLGPCRRRCGDVDRAG